jgi:hypothetical protein
MPLDPNGIVRVPRKQNVDPIIFWPITLGHLKRFGVPVLVSIPLAKLVMPGTPFLMVGMVAGVAAFLAFLKIGGVPFDRWLRNRVRYARRPKKYRDPRTKADKVPPSSELVPVKRVQDGFMVTPGKLGTATYALVIGIRPPNYAMLNTQDQQGLLSALENIFAGLECQMQIHCPMRPFDPVPHFKHIATACGRQRNRAVRSRALSYMGWLEHFLKENSILDREFYVVLSKEAPYAASDKTKLDTALLERLRRTQRELQATAKNIVSPFRNARGEAQVLSKDEARAVLQDAIMPLSYGKNSLVREALEQVQQPQAERTLAIPDVVVRKKHLRIGRDYVRTLLLGTYPDALPVTWLDDILAMRERITLNFHIRPKEPWEVRKHLVRSKNDMLYRIRKAEKAGRDTTEDMQILESLVGQLDLVMARQTRYFESLILFTVHADSARDLERICTDLSHKLRNLGITPFTETGTQEESWQSSLPIGQNRLARFTQTMDTPCVAAANPFLTTALRHETGNMVGFHAQTGAPFLLDGWRIVPHNRIVVGISGSGKSYSVKLDMLRTLMRRPESWLYVIDPLREFGPAIVAMGGQNILVGNPKTVINPFHILNVRHGDGSQGLDDKNPFERKMDFLETFFHIVVANATEYEMAVLMIKVRDLYARLGITSDRTTHARPAPILSDLLQHLEREGVEGKDAKMQEACRNLATYLRPRIDGALRSLNGPTNVRLDGNVVNFDLKDMENSWHQLFMFVVLDFIEQRLYSDLATPKQLYIDEAWKLMDHEETSRALNHLSRHVRHYHGGLTLITQTPESFLKNEHGRAFLMNCQQTFLFRQQFVPEEVRTAYGLDPEDAELLVRLGAAEKMKDCSACFMVVGDTKAFITIYASPAEHKLITTTPEEIHRLQQESRPAKAVSKGVLPPDPSRAPVPTVPTPSHALPPRVQKAPTVAKP